MSTSIVSYKLLLFLSLFFSYLIQNLTNGCGTLTHLLIAERARYYFEEGSHYRQLLDKHQDAFYAGAPYPDSFYSNLCLSGIYHGLSEDTHWAPFLNATINYINQKPKPWDIGTEKLFVFTMAVMSHQIADITWHSLYIDQGFIPTMGFINFHGSYSDAHTVADVGGDIWNAYMILSPHENLNPFKNWYVPIDDLYNIYQEYYGYTKINKTVIQTCSTLMVLQQIAEVLVGSKAFAGVARASNFLIDNMLEYFQGGFTDMASLTARKWQDAITMVERGTNSCYIPDSTVFINCSKKGDGHVWETKTKGRGISRELNLHGLSAEDLKFTPAHRGVNIEVGHQLKTRLKDLYAYHQKLKDQKQMTPYDRQAIPISKPNFTLDFSTTRSYSLLGWSVFVKDLDGDGNEDAIVGSPGYNSNNDPQRGRVYVLYSGNTGLLNEGSDFVDIDNVTLGYNRLLEGKPSIHSRFGFSVVGLDVNLDGYNDLVISAPAHSNHNLLDYNGKIFVYFGTGEKRKWNQEVNVTITCEVKFCNLGYSMTTLDMNGDGHEDLVIGSPYFSSRNLTQNGIATVMLASKEIVTGMVIPAEKLMEKWQLFGDQSYSWFGHRLYSKRNALLISQPYFRICQKSSCTQFTSTDKQSIGKLHVHTFQKSGMFNLSVEGRKQFDTAGYSSDIGDPFGNGSVVLAVGIPGMDVTGMIDSQPQRFFQAGSVTLLLVVNGKYEEVARFDGDRQYGRFGAVVKFADVNGDEVDDLIISAPFRDTSSNILIDKRINGRVYLFYGGSSFSTGRATVTQNCGTVSPCPEKAANQTLGYYLDYKTDFGSALAVLKARQGVQVLVSAPRNGDAVKSNIQETGNVYVYNTGNKTDV